MASCSVYEMTVQETARLLVERVMKVPLRERFADEGFGLNTAGGQAPASVRSTWQLPP